MSIPEVLTFDYFGVSDVRPSEIRLSRAAHKRLAERLRKRSASPCDDCAFAAHCGRMELVCKSFTSWVGGGSAKREARPHPVPHNGWLDDFTEQSWAYRKDGMKRIAPQSTRPDRVARRQAKSEAQTQ